MQFPNNSTGNHTNRESYSSSDELMPQPGTKANNLSTFDNKIPLNDNWIVWLVATQRVYEFIQSLYRFMFFLLEKVVIDQVTIFHMSWQLNWHGIYK